VKYVYNERVTNILKRYFGPQKKYNIPHSIINSIATGVKNPSVNLRADSIERRARFMAKTVFLLDVL